MIDCENLLKAFGVSTHLNWVFQWQLEQQGLYSYTQACDIGEDKAEGECDALTNPVSANKKRAT